MGAYSQKGLTFWECAPIKYGMERALRESILEDLETKIVLLSGPRQVGKTTLAKSLFVDAEYLNFDSARDRKIISEESWSRTAPVVILDELHKLKNWKRFLKGVYDTEGVRPRLLVTGSARLDTVRKLGDSLAGRHFLYTLHPFTLRELNDEKNAERNLARLLTVGGFPEPFLKGDEKYAAKWRLSHLDIILRQDLLDLEQVRQIKGVELLIDLLRTRVGSPVSMQNLAEDLQVDHKTVVRWISILESLFVIFSVSPYSRNIARALTKMRKFYFYDTGQVDGDEGARLENVVAGALLREIDWLRQTEGRKLTLHYIRDKSGREIDFTVVEGAKIKLIAEVKWSDSEPSKSFLAFKNLEPERAVQVVAKCPKPRTVGRLLKIVKAAEWLHKLEL